jgi:hypothetical protein
MTTHYRDNILMYFQGSLVKLVSLYKEHWNGVMLFQTFQEGKDHVDRFLNQLAKLKAFL